MKSSECVTGTVNQEHPVTYPGNETDSLLRKLECFDKRCLKAQGGQLYPLNVHI